MRWACCVRIAYLASEAQRASGISVYRFAGLLSTCETLVVVSLSVSTVADGPTYHSHAFIHLSSPCLVVVELAARLQRGIECGSQFRRFNESCNVLSVADMV